VGTFYRDEDKAVTRSGGNLISAGRWMIRTKPIQGRKKRPIRSNKQLKGWRDWWEKYVDL